MIIDPSTFYRSTLYEEEIIRHGCDFPIAIQRYQNETQDDGTILCRVSTNDDNDDGYPDGAWSHWTMRYVSADEALKACGKCRVGISGVIVTVMLDGKEIR